MIRIQARSDVSLSEIAKWRESLGFFYLFEDLSSVLLGGMLVWEATFLDQDVEIAVLFKTAFG